MGKAVFYTIKGMGVTMLHQRTAPRAQPESNGNEKEKPKYG